eukprot:3539085-Pyramimonas_sp.AAC.1
MGAMTEELMRTLEERPMTPAESAMASAALRPRSHGGDLARQAEESKSEMLAAKAAAKAKALEVLQAKLASAQAGARDKK